MIAATAGDPFAARRALQTALAAAEPLDALRPFVQAGPGVRALLAHHHGSFGAADDFADRALATGPRRENQQIILSAGAHRARNAPVPALNEIADDLTVSVNTVKSHIRSICTQLGVGSRRSAVLTAHEHGLLSGVH